MFDLSAVALAKEATDCHCRLRTAPADCHGATPGGELTLISFKWVFIYFQVLANKSRGYYSLFKKCCYRMRAMRYLCLFHARFASAVSLIIYDRSFSKVTFQSLS